MDVLSDNATMVAYINKEGRTLSPSLCRLALQVSPWCREHPVASHFSGSKNVLVDALSRGKHHHPTEWSMHKVTVALIFEHWPTPHVDLFAFEKNQVPISDAQRVECFDTELGTPIWVRVPTIQPHTEGIEETGCSRQPGSY